MPAYEGALHNVLTNCKQVLASLFTLVALHDEITDYLSNSPQLVTSTRLYSVGIRRCLLYIAVNQPFWPECLEMLLGCLLGHSDIEIVDTVFIIATQQSTTMTSLLNRTTRKSSIIRPRMNTRERQAQLHHTQALDIVRKLR